MPSLDPLSCEILPCSARTFRKSPSFPRDVNQRRTVEPAAQRSGSCTKGAARARPGFEDPMYSRKASAWASTEY